MNSDWSMGPVPVPCPHCAESVVSVEQSEDLAPVLICNACVQPIPLDQMSYEAGKLVGYIDAKEEAPDLTAPPPSNGHGHGDEDIDRWIVPGDYGDGDEES